MKLNRLFILSLTTLIFISCNNDTSKTEIKTENRYVKQEIGWTMQIPDGWEILDKTTQDLYKNKGKKMVNEFNKENRTYNGLIYLLGFRKNQFNIFQSNFEKIEYKDLRAWSENREKQKLTAAAMYTSQGIEIDTISSTEKIDGINFSVFLVTVYNQLGGVRYTQKIYGSYINGFDFVVLLNYNKREEEEILHKFWRNSKFKK